MPPEAFLFYYMRTNKALVLQYFFMSTVKLRQWLALLCAVIGANADDPDNISCHGCRKTCKIPIATIDSISYHGLNITHILTGTG